MARSVRLHRWPRPQSGGGDRVADRRVSGVRARAGRDAPRRL